MRLTLPLPPSANAYWRHVGNRVLLSKEAREYRDHCAFVAALQWKGEPLSGKVRVHADVYMTLRGDLDNRIKQLLDALQATVLHNDSQVWDLRLVRHHERDEPRVELTIEAIEVAA